MPDILYGSTLPPTPGLSNFQAALLRQELSEDVIQTILDSIRTNLGANTFKPISYFGAVGNGTTDDSSAFQSALNSIANGETNYVTLLPKTYAIGTTLTWTGSPSYGGGLIGVGGRTHTGSRLKWIGSAAGTLLNSKGLCRCQIEGINFDANDLAKYAWLAEYNSIGAAGSFYNSFYHCAFSNATGTGSGCFAVGTAIADTYQVSEFDFYSCDFGGVNAKAGFLQQRNGNTKNFRFFGGSCVFGETGFDCGQSSGSYVIHGMFMGGHTVAGIKVGPTGFWDLTGVEYESSGSDQPRFMDASTSANAAGISLSCCDINVKCPSDDLIIKSAGSLTLKNNQFVNDRTAGALPRIQAATQVTINSAGPGVIDSSGNYFANATIYVPFYDDAGNALLGTDNARLNQYYIRSFGDYGGVPGSGTLPRLVNTNGGFFHVNTLEARDSGKTAAYTGRLTQEVTRMDYTYTDFQVAATTKDINIMAPRTEGERVVGVYLTVSTVFGGTAGTLQFKVGSTLGGNEFLLAVDAKTLIEKYGKLPADLGTALTTSASQGAYVQTTAYDIRIRLTSGSGNLTGLNQGACSVWVVTEQLP